MPTAEDFQIRLWTDRFRGSELIYQPSIIGLESEGLSEILEHTLNFFGRAGARFRPQNPECDEILGRDYRADILSYVLLTGGNTLVPNFDNRIK
jgi:actin-related protein